jgi:hypothetical protein
MKLMPIDAINIIVKRMMIPFKLFVSLLSLSMWVLLDK